MTNESINEPENEPGAFGMKNCSFYRGDEVVFLDKKTKIQRWGIIKDFVYHKSGTVQVLIDLEGKSTKGVSLVKRLDQIKHR